MTASSTVSSRATPVMGSSTRRSSMVAAEVLEDLHAGQGLGAEFHGNCALVP